MQYRAYFDDDNPEGGFVVTFPDFPEAVTQGETLDEALTMARDALAMALAYRIEHNEAIPSASMVDGSGYRWIGLSAIHDAKLSLYQHCRGANLRKVDLARMLGIPPPNVDRLFRFDRATRMDQLEAAFSVLGKRLVVTVEDAA